MAKYQIHVFCNECGETHNMGISISLNDGPPEKDCIGNTYAGKKLPPEITALVNNKITCPNTGKLTAQEDNNQVFLVAVK